MVKKFNRFLQLKLHHLLFWIVYYIVWVQVYRGFYKNFNDLLLVTLVYAIAHAGMYYCTQYLLIPHFFRKKKIAAFILSFAILLMVSVVFMYFSIRLILGKEMLANFGENPYPIMAMFGVSNIFMTAVLLSIKAMIDNYRNQRVEEKKEKERLETELQYLRAQVNPHFLFNTINSVYVLIKQDPDKASDTLIKLSDLLRSQLYEFGEEKISIEQELSYLENYIELERMRKGNKLAFELVKGPGLQGFKIAPLMLMPFLENCFKHVSAYSGQNNAIRVKLTREKDHFRAQFYNTKEEMAEKQNLLPGGIGLRNVRRRLELLYPNAYSLHIKDLPDSFEVTLTLTIDAH
ncbi:MAG: hypothetical protein EA361_18910 [Bacteroidetes bacterium]|nr:MAG: hypothetical protein EA361_18910 [Bacteroidota bacterium]